MKLKPSQKKLYNLLVPFIKKKQDDNIFLVEGEGGSGKTATICYLLNRLIEKNFLDKYNLILIAPTNAAKKVLKNKLIESTKINPENFEKIKISLNRNLSFNTIHSFFRSSQEFDEEGNQYFELTSKQNVLSNLIKIQKKNILDDPYNKIRNKSVIIVDECSMIDPLKYNLFKNLINELNVKIIFMGDRNQLSYIKDKNEKQDFKYLSPVFTEIKNKFLLKGNQRSNDPKITKIINRSKKSVINSTLDFKIKKKDISENIDLITDKDLKTKKVKDLIKNFNPKIITYSNKRRNELNNYVRLIKYKDNPHFNSYFFLENENIIFEETFQINGLSAYYNTDEFVIKTVKYDIIDIVSFFDIFRRTFIVQEITFEDDIYNLTLTQICKNQLDLFKYIITILKRCVKDFFVFDIKKENSFFRFGKKLCKCCDNEELYFRHFYKGEYICKKCYLNVRDYIDKKNICRFCGNINNHEECSKKNSNINHSKLKKHVYRNMYRMIQELNNSYNLPIKYSYSITTYKSQGSTYQNILIDYRNIYNCNRMNIENLTRSLYVAISRVQNKIWFLNYFK